MLRYYPWFVVVDTYLPASETKQPVTTTVAASRNLILEKRLAMEYATVEKSMLGAICGKGRDKVISVFDGWVCRDLLLNQTVQRGLHLYGLYRARSW